MNFEDALFNFTSTYNGKTSFILRKYIVKMSLKDNILFVR